LFRTNNRGPGYFAVARRAAATLRCLRAGGPNLAMQHRTYIDGDEYVAAGIARSRPGRRRCLGVSVPHGTRRCAPFSRVRFRANRTLNRHRRMTESDPFQTSAARDCCDAQCGISYSGVVGCNSRGERSTCGRRRASTLGFTRPSQPSWENVGCADDPTSLRAMRCSASRPMGQSRRTNTPDEFAGWARFTSAATPLPRRRQARRTRAVSALHVRE